MTDRQARVCVYCAAGSVALSIATLALLIMFSIGFQATLQEIRLTSERDDAALKNWAIAVYERLIASGCNGAPWPPVPNGEKKP